MGEEGKEETVVNQAPEDELVHRGLSVSVQGLGLHHRVWVAQRRGS